MYIRIRAMWQIISLGIRKLWRSPLNHQLLLLHPVYLLLLHLHHHLRSHGWSGALLLSLVVLSLSLKESRIIRVHWHLWVSLLRYLLLWNRSSLHIIKRHLIWLIGFLIHFLEVLIVLLVIFEILRALFFILTMLRPLRLISNLIIVLIGLRI